MNPLLEKLTIAIPVYNDKKYIRSAIESCLTEAGHIVICDNCSTDGTSEICAEFAAKYPHVKHVKHASNIGAFENFKYPLFECGTEYFCWVGSHDLLSAGYSLPLLQEAEKDPAVALAVGTIEHIGESGEKLGKITRSAWANKTKDGNALERVGACVTSLRDCFMFYGVFRAEMARKAWRDTPCLGFDRAMLVRTAANGKMIYVPDSTFYARDFNISRDSKKDQERRTIELSRDQGKALPKNLFTRNMMMIETVLEQAKNPYDLTLALRLVDKINRRFQNRRYYQRIRLMQIAGAALLILFFSLLLRLYPF